ncbi:MAG: c-type cytochrome [Desulfobaccales bacterium]
MIDAIYAFLERLGYPHPVHPLFVHLTIGMVTGALVFGIVARLWRSPSLWLTARNCITFALISAVPTALTGYMDWQYFFAGGWLFYFKVKLILAFVLLILLSLGVIVSRKAEARFLATLTIYTLCFLTVVGLGYYGGQVVYGSWTPKFPERLRVGARLFRGNCSGCHPHGGNLVAPNLPLSHAPQLAEIDTFQAFVRHPTMPDGSQGVMPAFSPTKISNQQIKDLYQYIFEELRYPKRQ